MAQVIENKKINLAFLDGIRGLAAFYVLVSHARWLLWEGYTDGYLLHPEAYNLFDKSLMYFFSLFRWGRASVLLFFVLSGFVIHLRYANNFVKFGDNAKFDFFDFFKRRARRIYPAFVFALIFTYFIDQIGIFNNYSIYFWGTHYGEINRYIHQFFDLKTLAGNLLFVMDTYTRVWGSNGPFWSLKYEWWFYMFYPLFWYLSRKNIYLATAMLFILFLGTIFISNWYIELLQVVFSMMLSWWFGVLLADIYVGRLKIKFIYLSGFSFLIIPLAFKNLLGAVLYDTLWALGFMGILAFLFFLKQKNFELKWLYKLKWLGDMSYTLYLIHFPILVLLSGWYMNIPPYFKPQNFNYMLLGIIISMIVSYFAHFVIEKPFIRKKNK